MKRRELMLASGAWAALTAAHARAQPAQAPLVRRIGLLMPGTPKQHKVEVQEFLKRLRERGWIQDKGITLETTYAGNQLERLPALARELLERKIAVIVVATTPGARAAKEASSSIPVIFAWVADPVGSGLVTSLGRPGGNVTGVSNLAVEIVPKQIELLKALVPKLERVAELRSPAMGQVARGMSEQFASAAARAGVGLLHLEADKAEDLEPAFAAAVRARAAGMVVTPAPLYINETKRIVQLAKQYRIATVSQGRVHVAAGGLASYGIDFVDGFARTAAYVDKILRGAKPADLPVEQADRFAVVINRRTAAELGLKISPEALARATEVIE